MMLLLLILVSETTCSECKNIKNWFSRAKNYLGITSAYYFIKKNKLFEITHV